MTSAWYQNTRGAAEAKPVDMYVTLSEAFSPSRRADTLDPLRLVIFYNRLAVV